jgi:dipeptidyl aminopeptidase/acylaminoacyl peptidase
MKTLLPIFSLAILAAAMPAIADRAPVLKQIKVPHDYYYREMYLPQLTAGPSAVAWSPDSRSLVYAMAGSLWKQRVDAVTAEEITAGPGYDYEPDWSPDGKTVVFVRYWHDAMQLCALDVSTGSVTQLTTGADVNLEPRWSPNGQKIAFVSTKGTGHFHIFVGRFGKAGFTYAPWSVDRQSKVARYYYSPFDQQLSPTWAPDGSELIYVDNPDVAYGSGWLWRRRIDQAKPAQLIHREETNWKVSPDWSPDGKRVVYSSYAGRQTNQLWLVTAGGEDYPIQITYGEFDSTRPRWSPDGSQIAFISNQSKSTELWLQEAVGGARHKLAIAKRTYKRPMGTLALQIVDEHSNPVAARVAVLGSDGRSYAPDNALMRGDDSFDRGKQDFETHYFQTRPGEVRITIPAGNASVTVWHGDRYRISRSAAAAITPGKITLEKVVLTRLDIPRDFERWQSADVHVHMNYGGTYRTTPPDLVGQAQAEDLDFVFDLLVNKEQRVPDMAYFSPHPDPASTRDIVLAHSQEYHSSYWGHLGLLGLDDHYIIPGYAAYPYTAAASLYPDNAAVADLAHKQHALVGYVHPFDTPPDPNQSGLTDELSIDVALGKVDYYEVVGFSNHRTSADIWYRLLNCGFNLPAAGGTDAMTNYASLRGPVGLARVYVLPDPLSNGSPLARERAWLSGLKAGRSMATNGPLLGLTVEGRLPGGQITFPAGAHPMHYNGWLRSLTGIDHVELVFNGTVVKSFPLSGNRTSANLSGDLDIDRSGWLLLRAWNEHATPDVFDIYPYATTSPIFIAVGSKPLRSKTDAEFFLRWIERVRESAATNADYNSTAERTAVLNHIDAARRVFEHLREDAGH